MAHLPHAKAPLASHYWYRGTMPGPELMDQWRGVYHATDLHNYIKWKILMARKRAVAAERTRFTSAITGLLSNEMAFRQSAGGKEGSAAIFANLHQRREHMMKLNAHGLVDQGMVHFDALLAQNALTADQCAQAIRSLSAPALLHHIHRTQGNHDANLARRLLSDRQGSMRFSEGERIFDAVSTTKRSAVHYNALMQLALTCGYSTTKRVTGELYDAMGAAQVQPNIHTYELVVDSLCQQNNIQEADGIMTFLRSNAPEELNTGLYNTLMKGYRANRLFDRTDELWGEMVTNRRPTPNAETAEAYLRSIIDLTYTPTSENMALYGQVHQVEKKRIPLVLMQMEQLGIPLSQLSRPLADEIEDALRKFTISKHRFYTWGRAIKLFNFVDFRRQNGWAYDLKEVHLTLGTAPSRKPVNDDGKFADNFAPAGQAELPAEYSARDPWEELPLGHLFQTSELKEHMHDTKSGQKWYDDKKLIHERSPSWMSESPQTRYDGLYGQTNVNIPATGIRRHLSREHPNKEEILARDQQIMRSSLQSARRMRHKVELNRTHRTSAE